jgi:hypothetical protein
VQCKTGKQYQQKKQQFCPLQPAQQPSREMKKIQNNKLFGLKQK